MNELDDFYKCLARSRCNQCPYAKEVMENDIFIVPRCYHELFYGKLIFEIEECPKAGEQE